MAVLRLEVAWDKAASLWTCSIPGSHRAEVLPVSSADTASFQECPFTRSPYSPCHKLFLSSHLQIY